MALTYTAIATVTVGSGGSSTIEFANIPQTYTDLVLKFSLRSTYSGSAVNVNVNINNKGSNTGVTTRDVRGNGSAASSAQEIMVVPGNTATASTFGNGEMYFTNYTGNTNKSISADSVNENNATTAFTFLNAILWSYTEAITNIKLGSDGSGNWMQYSTATLYGIKNTV